MEIYLICNDDEHNIDIKGYCTSLDNAKRLLMYTKDYKGCILYKIECLDEFVKQSVNIDYYTPLI